jgi:transposase
MPRARRPYPSDLTDQEWELLEPLLESSERRGRPPKWPARHVADAVFYLLRSGCAWRMLPREYPPWQKPFTTTFANGVSTDGCVKPTSGCKQRCASGKVATPTQAGR